MSIRDLLESVVRNVDGSLAASIMAYDGISIDEVTVEQPEFDTQLLAVEYANVLKEIKRAVNIIKMGDLEEVIISTARTSTVVRVLNDDLFAALVMRRGGNIGKGRHMVKLTSIAALREIS